MKKIFDDVPPLILSRADEQHAAMADLVRSLIDAHRKDIATWKERGVEGGMATAGVLGVHILASGLSITQIALMLATAVDKLARGDFGEATA